MFFNSMTENPVRRREILALQACQLTPFAAELVLSHDLKSTVGGTSLGGRARDLTGTGQDLDDRWPILKAQLPLQ